MDAKQPHQPARTALELKNQMKPSSCPFPSLVLASPALPRPQGGLTSSPKVGDGPQLMVLSSAATMMLLFLQTGRSCHHPPEVPTSCRATCPTDLCQGHLLTHPSPPYRKLSKEERLLLARDGLHLLVDQYQGLIAHLSWAFQRESPLEETLRWGGGHIG